MKTPSAFKKGEIISLLSADYVVEGDELVLSDGCRLKHKTEFNATVISRFLIATVDLAAREEVHVNMNTLFYDVTDSSSSLFHGFKHLAEEEKQHLYMYADEEVRKKAIKDGFIPQRKEGGIKVVQRANSILMAVSQVKHDADSIVFTSSGVLLPFPLRSTIELPGERHLRLTGGSEFIEHSCLPNIRLEINEDSIRGISLRPIEEGEVLSYNYLCTEWEIAKPFYCGCNIYFCYGFIRGFKYLEPRQKDILLPDASAAIKEKYSAPPPPTGSLALLAKTTSIAVTSEGKVAAQRYIPSGMVLMHVNRFCVRPREIILDALHIPHSCDANTILLEDNLVTCKSLLAGDPLYLNLSTLFYKLPLPFECQCESKDAPHLVKGFSSLDDEEKNKLMPFTELSVLVEALRHGFSVQSSSPLINIKRNPSMGEVTYSADFIPKGTRVFSVKGLVIPFPTIYTVYLGDGNHLLFSEGAQFLAHSCEPNTRLIVDASSGNVNCISTRDIEPGEITSFNYLTTEWDMARPFKCHCGSASCYSMIKGFRYLDDQSQLRLWPYISSGVKSLFTQHRRSALSNLDSSLVYVDGAAGELRVARDLPSGVVLLTATSFRVVEDKIVLDDLHIKHACKPTAVFLEGRVVLRCAAVRGDCVTLNINHLIYKTTPPFSCSCGCENCMGEVQGFIGLTDEQKSKEIVYVDSRARAMAVDDGYSDQSTCPLVEIKFNGAMGQATFAKSDIHAGTRFFNVSGLVLPFPTIYSILLEEGQHLLFADGAQCLAHSCDPNVRIIIDSMGKRIGCLALRDIKKGELISFNYLTTEWDMQSPFTCRCGAEQCYREIRGLKYLEDEARQKLWSMVTPAIKSLVISSKGGVDAWKQIAYARLFVDNAGIIHVAEDMKEGSVLMHICCIEIIKDKISLDGLHLRHHCSPTAAIIENRLVLISSVSSGDEINVNFNCLSFTLTEEFVCNCNHYKEGHKIRGFKWLSEEEKNKWITFTEPNVCTLAIRDDTYHMKCHCPFINISEGHVGLEVHATSNISKNTRFMMSKGLCLPFQTSKTIQLSQSKHLLLIDGAQFISHSCDPNCRIRIDGINNTIECEALRDIEKDEVITYNYVAVEWDLYAPFDCLCHSKNCLHEIRGFKYLSNAQRFLLQQQVTPVVRQLEISHTEIALPPYLKNDTNMGMLQVISTITRGTVILECTDIDVQPSQVSIGGDSFIIRHEENANTVFVEGRFVSKQTIEKGEFLTVDMNLLVYDMVSLFPHAVVEGCRGFRYLEESLKQSLLYLSEPPVRAQAMHDGWMVKSTSPLVEVRQNGEMGQTAYTVASIASRDVLFHCTGLVVPFPTMYTVCVGENKHLLFGDGAECIAHHCDPNLQVVLHEEEGTFDFVALRSIEAGEMLTFNYCTTEWTMNSPFVCLCGSPHCAGTIRGFSNLKEMDRQRLWSITTPVVKRYASKEGY